MFAKGQRQPPDWTRAAVPPTGGVQEGDMSSTSRLQGLQRENGRLQEQLRSSEELNATLRSELDLHRSIMAQTGSNQEGQADDQEGSGPQIDPGRRDEDISSQTTAAEQPRTVNSGTFITHIRLFIH